RSLRPQLDEGRDNEHDGREEDQQGQGGHDVKAALDSVVSRRPFAWRSQCLENRFMTLGSLGSLRLRIDVHPNRQPLDGRLVETLAEFAPQARIELARDAGLRIETR